METKRPDNLKCIVPIEKVQGLFDMAFQLQNKGIANVFFDFQAHCAWINIRVYIGGWTPHSEPSLNCTLSAGEHSFSEDRYEYIMQELTELYDSEISYEKIQKKREQAETERKRAQYEKLKAEFES